MIHILSWTTKASSNTFQAATFKVVEIEGLNFKEKWNSRTFLDCANPGSIHLLQTDGKSLDDPDSFRRT